MPDAITLWVPMLPDNANGRGHWTQFHRAQKRYVEELETRRTVGQIPPPPRECPARARIDVLRALEGRARPIDTDNLVRRCKPLVDWLVRSGYLRGDDPARLAWGAVEQRRNCCGPEAPPLLTSVRVTLTPLEGSA